MSSTNRILNRGLLLLCGLLLAAAGAAAILSATQPRWVGSWLPEDPVGNAWSQVSSWFPDLPDVGGVPGAAVVALAVTVLLIALLVMFVLTRGRGRTATVLQLRADGGRTSVDRNVAEAMLADTLRERPDVLTARTGVYRVRGAAAIDLVLTVRRGADLCRVLAAAQDALDEWDALAGVRIPVLVHLSDRSRLDGLRSSTRVR